jgi:hypothetical protein
MYGTVSVFRILAIDEGRYKEIESGNDIFSPLICHTLMCNKFQLI